MAPTTRSARRSTLRSYTRWYSIDPSSRSASSSPIRKLAPKKKKPLVKEESTPYGPSLINTRVPFEILEAIFLQLNRKTLLISAQRVCRDWSALIKSSVALQEMLLFRPVTAPRTEEWKNDKIFLRIFGCMLRSQWVPYPKYRKYKKQGNWLGPDASWRYMNYTPYMPAMWKYYSMGISPRTAGQPVRPGRAQLELSFTEAVARSALSHIVHMNA